MSQAGDHCRTLREMIQKYPGAEAAVVETFYETVSNAEWDTPYIISFLEQAKGVNSEGDRQLDIFIEREKSYLSV